MFVIVQVISLVLIIYPTVIGFLGMGRKKASTLAAPQKRFAVLVCAHNEEQVVGQIVRNILKLDYPKELYDLYVICDNCTDHTADVVRENGGIAMERHDVTKKGKGHGLEWMFRQLWKFEKEGTVYDAVVMFDADNLVSKNFLQVMNSKLLEGHEVVQGYLDSKNPADSWITKSYAFAYWSTNRVYQLARDNMNLSAQIGGTGVVVTTDVLKTIGWGATSLTEDLEFTQRYIIQTGKRVAWAHEAKIYDEKPLDMKASWKQRVRWMQGHAACMMKYGLPLLKETLRTRSLLHFDALVYLISPSRIILTVLLVVFMAASLSGIKIADYGLNNIWVYAATTFMYVALPFAGLLYEKKAGKMLWFFPTFIYSLTWYPIILLGFIKRNQNVWSHTEHTRAISEVDVERLEKEAMA
ncbi:hypothetical protein SD71_01220 [Cohnella kolymensis]|uniref:Glycosyl transferase family 2 n=2 Tax=Cohnella kolymensis TaxID=1590652 RepID=A0ABR5A9J7_9BACL|nr:hypothetical protein SD71_01220 [Cohnella kolymensis]